ncbi:Golgin imh1 [Exophiala xenobiotica]|uniref:Golgin imh1 n=1 Tax=Vermiconidia calcicola TaxID=1690605 RepID=A0AAV9QCA4_9PEZI|nr:Golgin imh1 [Exophiala xenobiotica]KAK5537936.1 Golgin imh1 [Chaetothyriales sp. CCFEE 6169]KAK5539610.1 Golgin imh1 [Vermiconidia calcicola]KAK5303874.1 Golgin imh1 [Exophiala xenobiotica]KAK5338485.1 Golgin imh1 [Exophiala xenobiotica]
MFQRLKGAIDRGIAEEQARQRQVGISNPPTRNPPRRRPQAQNGTAQRASSKQRDQSNVSTEKGPDPAQFEPEFAIGDDESAGPSRVATPKPDVKNEAAQETETEAVAIEGDGQGIKKETEDSARASTDGKPPDSNGGTHLPIRSQELPTEVRVKLRKLDRMEVKYAELLKAYKTAHSRIQSIESFEASLRENTPLTSINDPGSLVEYLNQINLKSDMVLDELKRVTTDRDEYKKKFQAAEEETGKLRNEVTDLKAKADSNQQGSSEPETPVPITVVTAGEDASTKDNTEPDHGAKSPASTSSRIASFSLFSPRSKAVSPPPKDSSEDLFSYESEHTKLESELHERQIEVEDLKKQVTNLHNDLKVARESTESMVESLETATRELHALRDAKDKFDQTNAELQKKIDDLESKAASDTSRPDDLQQEIDQLQGQKNEVSERVQHLENQIRDLESNNTKLKAQIESSDKDVNILNEKLTQKDSIVKDLEDTLAMYRSAERQEAAQKDNDGASEKKLATMQGIMDSLRSQLDTAEETVADLKSEIQRNQEDFSKRPSTTVFGFLNDSKDRKLDSLRTREDVVNYLAENFGLQRASSQKTTAELAAPSPAPSEAATGTSKKKNKKKKKGKSQTAPVEDAELETPVTVSENLAEVEGSVAGNENASQEAISKLEGEIASLRVELTTKTDTIDRLSKQLKDQEELQEEIETLRDDLLHQGEEHVEARDALKEAKNHKQALQESVDKLEKELIEALTAAATGADSQKAHEEILEQFDELKSRCSTLENDLAASEQLAAGRFKDITDLKDLLSKAQPELRSLRNEVAELRAAKEDLKNKTGKLSRLEARHEDIKAELKGFSKRLGDKDTEIKVLQQKIEQEAKARTRLEKDLEKTEADRRMAESRGQEAAASSEQLTNDLNKAKEESTMLRAKLRDLEEQISLHNREATALKEEISMKTALHASSQSLVQSLRDQTHELNLQAREATTRADSLEEELAEAQTMLSERTREGQTMRMLLDQAETGTESRIREMKERMDVAIEERDRVEDEASVSSRRMMREVEEARNKARDAQRALKVVEDEKEELEVRHRDWKRRRDELEQAASRASKEVEEVRTAMAGLREALDESERQVRELDGQKMDLRRMADEAKDRVEKLTKANKNLTEELKAAQQAGAKGLRASNRVATGGLDSGVPSSRTSIDSSSARSPTPKERMLSISTATSRSETPTGGGGLSQGTVDYVYLKNVLLQFLEQKDKGHQRQLIPVLGMLLHFDRKDEQKWMAAISTR